MVWMKPPNVHLTAMMMTKALTEALVQHLVAIISQPLSKQGLLAAILSGLLASLALPPHGITILILALGLPAMQLAFAVNWRQGFFIGWATGTGWFLYSLYWISNALVVSGGGDLALIPFSAIGLPVFLGLFWGVGFASAAKVASKGPLRLILLVIGLSLAEYARGFVLTGFPWNWPSMVLANTDVTMALVSVIGSTGGIVAVLMLAVMPALLLLNARGIAGGFAIILMLLMGVSAQQLYRNHDNTPLMQVRIVQPNIPQQEKWDRQKRPQHLAQIMAASRRPAERPLDLIIWPETAFAGFYEADRGVVNAISLAASSGVTPVLLGMLSEPEWNQFYNSAGVFTPGEGMGDLYHKRHLVPFGEYAPLRSYIPFIDAIAGPYDFSKGDQVMALPLTTKNGEGVKLLPLICYEVIFPLQTRRDQNKLQADVMVNLTNDAWFGNTIGPQQHLTMARMRSAELGAAMIRVANTGVSALIDNYGRITAKIDYDQKGIQDGSLPQKISTIYAAYGEAGFWGLIALLITISFVMSILTRRKLNV